MCPLSADPGKEETVLTHRNFRKPQFFSNLCSKHLSDYLLSGSQAKSDENVTIFTTTRNSIIIPHRFHILMNMHALLLSSQNGMNVRKRTFVSRMCLIFHLQESMMTFFFSPLDSTDNRSWFTVLCSEDWQCCKVGLSDNNARIDNVYVHIYIQ